MKKLVAITILCVSAALWAHSQRAQGLLSISANFEPEIAAPFDARHVVSNVAALTNATTFGEYAYAGMFVAVYGAGADSGIYVLKTPPATVLTNWMRIAETAAETDPIWSAVSNLYYLASNPSNYITSAEVPAETDPIWSAVSNLYATTNWVLGLNYVTASVTNGLSTTNWVLSLGYVTASVTNGLATTNWVNAQNFVDATITNGLAHTNWVLSLNYVTASVTNGLASQQWVDDNYLDEAAADLFYLSITNNFLQASTITNLLDAKVDVTDGVATNLTVDTMTLGGETRTNWPTAGGDVYLASNNVFAAGTTQTVETASATNIFINYSRTRPRVWDESVGHIRFLSPTESPTNYHALHWTADTLGLFIEHVGVHYLATREWVADNYLDEAAADALYGQLEANNNWTMTNTFNEVVVSNGFTIGGERRTTWPTAGGDVYLASNNVFAAGTTQSMERLVIGAGGEWTNTITPGTISMLPYSAMGLGSEQKIFDFPGKDLYLGRSDVTFEHYLRFEGVVRGADAVGDTDFVTKRQTTNFLDEAAADLLYVAITDGVSTNQEFAGTNFWSGGRVHYLPIDTDINAYIASAAVADGDVVELGAGTNTVTSSITIGKSIHLRGQGRGKTVIVCGTALAANRGLIELDADNAKIGGISVAVTGQLNAGVFAIGEIDPTTALSGLVVEDVAMTVAGTNSVFGIYNWNNGMLVDNCEISVSSSNLAYGVALMPFTNPEVTESKTSTVKNTRVLASAAGTFCFGVSASSVSGLDYVLSVENCRIEADNTGAGAGVGVFVDEDAGGEMTVTVSGGYVSGSSYDLQRADGTLTLHGAVTLANGTTSGTITYAGTTEAGAALTVAGVDVMDAIAAKYDASNPSNFLQASTITNLVNTKVAITDGVATNLTLYTVTLGGETRTNWPTAGGDVYSASNNVFTGANTFSNTVTTAGTNFWSGGRVHYLPIGADIGAYIASAAVADGDVVGLGAGTNTLTDILTIGKSIHLLGQGRDRTALVRNTAVAGNRAMIEIATNNVTISGMRTDLTGQSGPSSPAVIGRGDGAYANLTGWRLEGLDVVASSSGRIRGIYFENVDADVVECDVTVESDSTTAMGLQVMSKADGTASRVVNVYRSFVAVATDSTVTNAAYYVASSSGTHTNTLRLYGCRASSINTGTGGGAGVLVSGSDSLSVAEIYGGVLEGDTSDLSQNDTGVVVVHGPVTLANGTTSGTITYAGTEKVGAIEVETSLRLGGGPVVDTISTNHLESGSASALATTKYVEDKVEAKTFAIDYKGTDFGAVSTNVVDFDVDIGTSGAFIPLVSLYTTHTNPANDSIEDVVVSVYINPDRTGESVQYRATMSFYSQALTNAAAVGTNTVYVADSTGFELNNFVVMDPGSHDNGMTQNRVAGVGTGYIVLETGLATNYSAGVTIARGNQFGQFMYYDQTQADTFYGRLVFTNAVTADFSISLVTVD